MKGFQLFLLNIWALRSLIVVAVAFLSPISLLNDELVESKCAYGLIVMSILWMTEALPIPVTALLPVVIFPLLGVVPGQTICKSYFNETSMLFMGGLIVAVAVEDVGLHTRIAMGIVTLLGSNPNMLFLGVMLPTWFMSMWISNTAAASMMIPITQAVIEQIRLADGIQDNDYDNEAFDGTEIADAKLHTVETKSQVNGLTFSEDTKLPSKANIKENEVNFKRFGKGLAMSVAYGATSGGIATLTGTPPNIILQGQADRIYEERQPGADSGITFATWMGFAFPLSCILLILSWLWLQIFFLRSLCCKKSDETRNKAIQTAIHIEKKKLGPMKFGEVVVLMAFSSLALLWIFRWIPGFGGWANLFKFVNGTSPFARDSTSAMLIAVALFVLPRQLPNIFCWASEEKKPIYTPILTWGTAVRKVPWGIIMLLGGGFALAEASKISGLSKLVGCKLQIFNHMDQWVMNLVISFIVAAATEITSNSATATLLMPIVAELAISLGQHPLYLMVSSAVACSFAFMLPVATPPNAIVFSTGYIRIPDMAIAGIVMNVIATSVLTLAINTWGIPIFGLDIIPSIFNTTNNNSTQCV